MRHFAARTVRSLASLVPDGHFHGDSAHSVSNAASLADADDASVCFMRSHDAALVSNPVGLLIAPADFVMETLPPELAPHAILCHPYPEAAWALMLEALFTEEAAAEPGISPHAFIARDAVIGAGVSAAPGVFVASAAKIGEHTQLGPGVSIGRGAVIGARCLLYAGVCIYPGVRTGDCCIIHSGTVIGSDGFGFTSDGKGVVKVPQIGGVRIGDTVEIGANCAIDRGSIGDTIIEAGVKLDNLVHVAHNVHIGAGTMVAAQAGFAGSTRVGKMVQVGGQAGFSGHLTIGDGARIGGQAGVTGSVPAGSEVAGFPARSRREFMRMIAWLARAARKDKSSRDE